MLVLHFAIGHRSLLDHGEPVAEALTQSDLPGARRRVARLVSRETARLSPEEMAGRPPNRYWRTATTPCSARRSGLCWPVRARSGHVSSREHLGCDRPYGLPDGLIDI